VVLVLEKQKMILKHPNRILLLGCEGGGWNTKNRSIFFVRNNNNTYLVISGPYPEFFL
jgi:hypothetical protein